MLPSSFPILSLSSADSSLTFELGFCADMHCQLWELFFPINWIYHIVSSKHLKEDGDKWEAPVDIFFSKLQCVTYNLNTHWLGCLKEKTPGLAVLGFSLLLITSPWQQPLLQVSQESFEVALLVVIVDLSCQSPRSRRCSSICNDQSLHVVAHWLQGLAVPMPAFVLCWNNRWL